MKYILERTVFGFCWWDLVALVILVGVCVYSYIKIRQMKEQEDALNDRLAGKDAVDAMKSEYEPTV